MGERLSSGGWEIVTGLLPEDWKESGRQCGAFRRHRKVDSAEALLRLILLHVAGDLSVLQTVARAKALGWADLSEEAFRKRLCQAGGWLEYLCSGLWRHSRSDPIQPQGRRWRIVDATTVQEPGATGITWRVHYAVALPDLACDYVSVSDVYGGETLCRIPVQTDDVILADQGYSHRRGVDWVLSQQGHVIVRLQGSNFPLLDRAGQGVNLLPRLRDLHGQVPGTWAVQFQAYPHRRWQVWLHALRKSPEAAQRAKKRLHKERGNHLRAETLELAEYILVLTSLPPTELPAVQALALYRGRWQIELVIKVLKSLLGVGDLAKYDQDCARAWIQAKLLVALLIERLEREAHLTCAADSAGWQLCNWRRFREVRDSLKQVIAPALSLSLLLTQGSSLSRQLHQSHRRGQRQIESLVSIIRNQ